MEKKKELSQTKAITAKGPKKKEEVIELDVDPECPLKLTSLLGKFKRPKDVVSIVVNGKSDNVNKTISTYGKNVTFSPIYKQSLKGESLIRRSLVFLMSASMDLLNKDAPRAWFVKHQCKKGYFCHFKDNKPPTKKFLEELKNTMLSLVKKGLPINEKKLFYKDAVEYFKKVKQPITLKLLNSQNFYEVLMDVCGDNMCLHHRTLAYNTKFLGEFELQVREFGWVLVFKFDHVDIFYDQPKNIEDKRIIGILRDQVEFNNSCDVNSVGDINQLVYSKKIEHFISLSNTYHQGTMNSMVQKFKEERKKGKNIRLILIAGPSASGKTTFAKKLRIILKCIGVDTEMISVDNYFKANKDCPIDEETGHYDFECLEALRVDLMNKHLQGLFEGKEVQLPKFDFQRGIPIDNHKKMKIKKDVVLLMEGIHCLNDELTPKIDKSLKFKIFIAPLSPVSYDDRNYISNATFRLIRRTIRDWLRRGHGVENTFTMWPKVRRGEHMYIFPHMNEADFIFNTAFDYEIGVLKRYITPLLKKLKPSSQFYDDAQELLLLVAKFADIPYKYVPRDSILQEFIGGHWLN